MIQSLFAMPPKRKPRKSAKRPRLGQHFLTDTAYQQEILEHLAPSPGEHWLEIGPGHGEMTALLAPKAGHLVAVERDPKLAEELKTTFSEATNFTLLESDILKVSLPELARQHGVSNWRVYGSLPYYITSPILHLLFEALEVIARIHVVIQREVAERVVAGPGSRDYGYLSVAAQYYTRPEITLSIPRGAFRPPPKVESALVELTPREKSALLPVAEEAKFLSFVKTCFRHKRKTILNNLSGSFGSPSILSALERLELDHRSRAEQLAQDEFVELYQDLQGRTAAGSS